MLLFISITKEHLYWTCDHSLDNKTVLTKTNVCILSFHDQEKLYPTQLLKTKTLKYTVSLNPQFGAEKPERRRGGVLLCITVMLEMCIPMFPHLSAETQSLEVQTQRTDSRIQQRDQKPKDKQDY